MFIRDWTLANVTFAVMDYRDRGEAEVPFTSPPKLSADCNVKQITMSLLDMLRSTSETFSRRTVKFRSEPETAAACAMVSSRRSRAVPRSGGSQFLVVQAVAACACRCSSSRWRSISTRVRGNGQFLIHAEDLSTDAESEVGQAFASGRSAHCKSCRPA